MIGTTVAQYRIVEELGAGGMGVVYRAEDTKLGRQAALKFLPERMATDHHALERFRREARAASSLSHPNICTIYDIDEHEGRSFIAMELLEGRTLWETIQAGALSLDDWVRIGMQVADALDAAHAAGMIHRDIKPANIFITSRGQAKVLDFGLAKQADPEAGGAATAMPTATAGQQPLTREGATIGTIAYMSPEQARGEELDGRSDLFSLGAVLYEMATGKAPFAGNTSAVVFDGILHGAPAPAVHLRPDAPPEMVRIIEKSLEKDRAVRYQTAAELAADLRRLRRDSEASRAGLTPVSGVVTAQPRRSRGGPWIGASIAIVALVVVVAGFFWSRRGDEPLAPSARTAAVSVAVLPFQNLGAGEDQQHLALAVPDEITTALSHTSSLAIRPFSMTRKYSGAAVDPGEVARELGVVNVVTGHFSLEGDSLRLSLEAIDAAGNRVVWKDGVTVPRGDMLALRETLAERVRSGMLPALGVVPDASSRGTLPANEEAYSMFLRSLALDGDGEPNRQAIRILERAVALDPDYAPAWAELSKRRYDEGSYGADSLEQKRQLLAASWTSATRALELDPDLVEAVQYHAVLAVEQGRMNEAYDRAAGYLERNPNSSKAHFTLSYVYRYAGLIEEAGRECDAALALDGSDPGLRSCAITFLFLDRPDRAELFIDLDPNSYFAEINRANIAMRRGRVDEVIDLLSSVPAAREDHGGVLLRCLENKAPREIEAAANEEASVILSEPDPEGKYWFATRAAYCGLHDLALRAIAAGIDGGYCSYPAMDSDPFLDALRGMPRFEELREAGRACRQRFLDHREARRSGSAAS